MVSEREREKLDFDMDTLVGYEGEDAEYVFDAIKMLGGGPKVGLTASCFDLLHAGHILMLEEAKSVCDYLVCALQTDPSIDRPKEKRKPIQSLVERQIQLQAVKFVDEIIVYETEDDLLNILKTRSPDLRIVGEEYIGRDFTGRDWCEKNNVEIYYNSRNHNFSTTSLLERIWYKQPSGRKDGSIPKNPYL
jgi:glycerol-3-phosphate cytidylyltransferase